MCRRCGVGGDPPGGVGGGGAPGRRRRGGGGGGRPGGSDHGDKHTGHVRRSLPCLSCTAAGTREEGGGEKNRHLHSHGSHTHRTEHRERAWDGEERSGRARHTTQREGLAKRSAESRAGGPEELRKQEAGGPRTQTVTCHSCGTRRDAGGPIFFHSGRFTHISGYKSNFIPSTHLPGRD